MNFSWRVVDLRDRSSRPIQLPGDAQGAVAAPAENLVLYWGSPTKIPPVKHAEGPNSERMLSLKMALIGSGEPQTVVSEIEYLSAVSFGLMKENQ